MRAALHARLRAVAPSLIIVGGGSVVPSPSLAVAVSGTTINVTVTDMTGGLGQTIIQRRAGAGEFVTIATLSPGTYSLSDSGLQAGVTYSYRALSLVGTTYSEPSATASGTIASGTGLSDGQLVTVMIPGGGANVPASNFSFLGGYNGPVEGGVVGNLFTSIAPAGWDMPGGTGTLISSEQVFNGTKTLLHDRSRGFQFGIAYNTGGIRRVGFARWSFLFLNPNNIQGGQLKQVRMVGGTSSRLEDISYANVYLTGWTGSGGVYAARNDSPSAGTNISGGTGREWHKEGEWITVQYRVTDSSAAGVADASIQVMTIRESTGEILGVWNQNNVLLRTSAAALIRNIAFQFYMGNNFNGASGCKLFLDRDIVAAFSDTTTPPKFICLGDAPTWSGCIDRTYCQFATWNNVDGDAEVSFYLNKGRHASLDGLYAYGMSDAGTVINNSGVIVQ